jgi:hypothetical protein
MAGDTDINSLVAEVESIKASTNLEGISQLFIKMSTTLQCLGSYNKTTQAIRPLLDKYIFPIRKKKTRSGFDYLDTVANCTNWFIADHDYFHDKFFKSVDILAFSAADVQKMDNLLNALKIESRKLSKFVKRSTSATGRISPHNEYSQLLRSKAQFLIR